jgi:hypothetical protein
MMVSQWLGVYLVVKVFGPPFWNQVFFDLSVDVLVNRVTEHAYIRLSHFANFIFSHHSG